MLGVCLTFAFTTQNTPLFLKQLRIPEAWIPLTLTISQSTEVVTLALLPMLLLRLGLRSTMNLALGAWLAALTILSVGWPVGLVVASQGLNGIFVAGYLVAGQVFVNSRAQEDLRASVQGLLSCINGAGLLFGNLLASWLRWLFAGDLPATFTVGACLTALLLLIFLAGFRPLAGRLEAVHPEETP
jgi:hypothetical protein